MQYCCVDIRVKAAHSLAVDRVDGGGDGAKFSPSKDVLVELESPETLRLLLDFDGEFLGKLWDGVVLAGLKKRDS